MATLTETGAYQGADNTSYGDYSGSLYARHGGEVQPDTRNLSSMLSPLLSMLGFGAVAIVAVSGQFPWFVAPLALFSFLGYRFLRG